MKLRAFGAAAGTLVAVAGLTLTVSLLVTAQTVPPALEQSATVNDAEIKSFAAAVVEVKRVTDSYLPALASAQTKQEQKRVEDAAFDQVRQVVESQGFTVSRFNQILSLASVSPDLIDRIRLHLPQ